MTDPDAPHIATRLAARLIEAVIVTFARLVCAPRVTASEAIDWQGANVFFANHSSNADTILIWSAIPPDLRRKVRPVAAADYWLPKALRRFIGLRVFRILPIQRDPAMRDTDPVAQMAGAVDQGASLILFPEGSRNMTDADLLPFKSGIYHLAVARPDLSFVPVWIGNLNGVLPKGERIPVPLICSLDFGAPLRLRPDEGKDAFLDRARTALLALKPGEGGA